jgi:hypothetical protein
MDQKVFSYGSKQEIKDKRLSIISYHVLSWLEKAARPEKDTTYTAFSKLM